MSVSGSDLEMGWSPSEGIIMPDGVDEEDVFGQGAVEPVAPAQSSVFNDNSVDEVLFASSSRSDDAYKKVKQELESSGVSVSRLDPGSVEEKDGEVFLDGEPASEVDATVYLRPKRWVSVEDNDDIYRKLIDAREDGVDFYGDPQIAMIAEDKKATKNVFRSKGVGALEDFSYEEALKRVEDGEELVVKPRYNSSCGDGVELVDSRSGLEAYGEDTLEDMLVEEYLPQGSDGENADMRMILTGKDSVRAERADGNGVANNLSNGGEYVEPPEKSSEEQYLEEVGSEVLGDGFYSIDYIRESDGSVKVMEVNSTSMTGINREMEKDLYSSIAEGVKSTGYQASARGSAIETGSKRTATV
ncbi:MAG: RimK family alpha-L-glutamate ligase [Candidatus Nanohalobium sp.]